MKQIAVYVLIALLLVYLSCFFSHYLPPANTDAALAPLQNAWLYLCSSVAQTVAAASGLMLALVILRIQKTMEAIQMKENSTAALFQRISQHDNYLQSTSETSHLKLWSQYCVKVREIANRPEVRPCFARAIINYQDSHECLEGYLSSILDYSQRESDLRSTIAKGMLTTSSVIIVSNFAIPLSVWITPAILIIGWIALTASLLFMLKIYWPMLSDLMPLNTKPSE